MARRTGSRVLERGYRTVITWIVAPLSAFMTRSKTIARGLIFRMKRATIVVVRVGDVTSPGPNFSTEPKSWYHGPEGCEKIFA
jgi:hypothetical protein